MIDFFMVNIENPVTNQVKQCKVGWSWTVFFFGFFPMLFRQDWKWLLITLVVDLLGLFTFGIVSFIANVILAVLYNKFYLTDLINAGWRPVDEASKNLLLAKGVALPVK